jgi:hypothetical protein
MEDRQSCLSSQPRERLNEDASDVGKAVVNGSVGRLEAIFDLPNGFQSAEFAAAPSRRHDDLLKLYNLPDLLGKAHGSVSFAQLTLSGEEL